MAMFFLYLTYCHEFFHLIIYDQEYSSFCLIMSYSYIDYITNRINNKYIRYTHTAYYYLYNII